mgnify:CR=1 FL=1
MELTVNDAVNMSIDNGDYPKIIPVDYGNDLILKTKPEIKVRIDNPRKVKIDITTFGVTHYYADIIADGVKLIEETDKGDVMHCGFICEEFSKIEKKNRGKYDYKYRIEVLRLVTKEEIEKYPVRWQGYNEGDTTNAFYSEEEALEHALKIVKARFGKGWVLELENETINL